MTDIILVGCLGRMGRAVTEAAKEKSADYNIKYGVDVNFDGAVFAGYPVVNDISEISPDGDEVIVDFSHHSAGKALCDYAAKKKLPLILCTTGYTDDELEYIKAASERTAVFRSGNMSVGVALLCSLAKKAASVFPEADIEIVETHHNHKLDAPSGTALMLAEAIREVRPAAYPVTGRSGHAKRTADEIGIHAIRMGNIVGEHEVIIGTPNQTITLKHEAHSRALFAEGALAAAGFLIGKGPGLYAMKDLVG